MNFHLRGDYALLWTIDQGLGQKGDDLYLTDNGWWFDEVIALQFGEILATAEVIE